MISVYIPIRSGSKGVPDKNISTLAGYPLFAWSIAFASLLTHKNSIFVSSDSNKYLDIASAYGCSLIKRPVTLSLDTTSTESSMCHDLLVTRPDILNSSDWICLLQATSPFRCRSTANSIKELVKFENINSILTVNEDFSFSWRLSGDYAIPDYDLYNRPRRQEVEATKTQRLVENGSCYLTRSEAFKNSHLRVSGNIVPLSVTRLEGLEIDSHSDFAELNALMSMCDLPKPELN